MRLHDNASLARRALVQLLLGDLFSLLILSKLQLVTLWIDAAQSQILQSEDTLWASDENLCLAEMDLFIEIDVLDIGADPIQDLR